MADIVKAREIRTDVGLGKHDLATQSIADKIYKLWGAHIKDNVLHISTCTQVDKVPTRWIDQDFPRYNAKACAIEFNGLWSRQTDGLRFYRLNTEYTPWVFWITLDNKLMARKYHDPDSLIMLDEEVTQVCATRGFGSPIEYELDQGLIVAYIKENQFAYYKNLCRQADGSFGWQGGGHLPLPTPVDTIGIFRGNDYRLGFTGTSGADVNLIMTERTWLGMATGIDNIETGIVGITMEVLPVAYIETADNVYGRESISTGIVDLYLELLHAAPVIPITAHNPDEFTIHLQLSGALIEDVTLAKSAFLIKDSGNVEYSILSIERGADASEIIFHMVEFTAALGNMFIHYTSDNYPMYANIDGIRAELASFAFDFAPDLTPPEGVAVEVIHVVFKPVMIVSKIDYMVGTNGEENISFDFANITMVVTKVGSNPL